MNDPATLLQLLKDKNITLGSVESLTGGGFGSLMVSVPGASASYMGGLITYAVREKISLANVKKESIDSYGVVSSEVAKEMAAGGAKELGVDVCVSCTGNAGPSVQAGMGLVGDIYLGISYKGLTKTKYINLKGDRNQIRQQAAEEMVAFAIKTVEAGKKGFGN